MPCLFKQMQQHKSLKSILFQQNKHSRRSWVTRLSTQTVKTFFIRAFLQAILTITDYKTRNHGKKIYKLCASTIATLFKVKSTMYRCFSQQFPEQDHLLT